jgi:hypothetical protein
MSSKHRTKADMRPQTPEAEQGDQMLERTIQIINYFHNLNPSLIFYMENPQGRMRHSPLLKALPHHRRVTVSYCKYGFDYRKHTDIWTNDFAWIPSPMCSAASPCDSVVDGRHPVAVRAHPGQETGPKTLHERYRIPPDLVRDVILSGRALVTEQMTPRGAPLLESPEPADYYVSFSGAPANGKSIAPLLADLGLPADGGGGSGYEGVIYIDDHLYYLKKTLDIHYFDDSESEFKIGPVLGYWLGEYPHGYCCWLSDAYPSHRLRVYETWYQRMSEPEEEEQRWITEVKRLRSAAGLDPAPWSRLHNGVAPLLVPASSDSDETQEGDEEMGLSQRLMGGGSAFYGVRAPASIVGDDSTGVFDRTVTAG